MYTSKIQKHTQNLTCYNHQCESFDLIRIFIVGEWWTIGWWMVDGIVLSNVLIVMDSFVYIHRSSVNNRLWLYSFYVLGLSMFCPIKPFIASSHFTLSNITIFNGLFPTLLLTLNQSFLSHSLPPSLPLSLSLNSSPTNYNSYASAKLSNYIVDSSYFRSFVRGIVFVLLACSVLLLIQSVINFDVAADFVCWFVTSLLWTACLSY